MRFFIMLLGLEMLVVPFDMRLLIAAIVAIPIILLARWMSVAVLIAPLRRRIECVRGTIRILTWGALRGGISVAMALSVPKNEYRDLILVVTYVVVIFSIVVQGLTIGPLIRRIAPKASPTDR